MKLSILFLLNTCLLGTLASSLSKRTIKDWTAHLVDGLYSITPFNPREFLQKDTKEQLEFLTHSYGPGSQHVFSSISGFERSRLVKASNAFQRFQLWKNYDSKGKGLLLSAMTDEKEIAGLLRGQDSSLISEILSKASVHHRNQILSKMNPTVMMAWLFWLNKDITNEKKFLSEEHKKSLAHEFTRVRTHDQFQFLDHDFVTRKAWFGPFLDELAEYISREEVDMVLSTIDPIIFLSRYTAKERQALFNLMDIDEKRKLFKLYSTHELQDFPDDFFERDTKKSYFAKEKEWKNHWSNVRDEIQQFDRLKRIGRVFSPEIIPIEKSETQKSEISRSQPQKIPDSDKSMKYLSHLEKSDFFKDSKNEFKRLSSMGPAQKKEIISRLKLGPASSSSI